MEFSFVTLRQQRNLGRVLAQEPKRQQVQQILQLPVLTKSWQAQMRQRLNWHRPKQLPVVPSNA
jgi:MOSC domain-containing protein YiiM